MNNIAGVVILYNPDYKELVRNIRSYIPALDFFYIIDNSQQRCPRGLLDDIGAAIPVDYIFNGANKGIPLCLNLAATLALNKGCGWLLTMDQDSYFEKEQFDAYLKGFENDIKHQSTAGIVGVSFDREHRQSFPSPDLERTNKVITSGSIINLKVWKDIGGFDEKLFIDEVDHEYCYRIMAQGGEVFIFPGIFLCHVLGNPANKGYFSLIAKKGRSIYSKQRVYFIVRNYLYVRKKYRHLFPGEFKARDRQVLSIIKNSLFFSGSFFGVIKKVFKGYADYKKNNFSAVL